MHSEKGAGFLIFLCMLYFGVSGIMVKVLGISPSSLYSLMAFGLGIVGIAVSVLRKQEFFFRKYFLFYLILAFFFSMNVIAFYKSYQLTSLANAVLSHYTAPIFIAVLSPFLLKERLETVSIAALVISTIGLFLIVGPENISFGNNDFLGIMYGTLSGFGYAMQVILYRLHPEIGEGPLIATSSIISLLFVLPFASIGHFGSANLALLLPYAILTPLVVTLYAFAVKHVRAQFAGIIGYTEIISVTIFGIFLLNEIPTMLTFIGGLLIIASGLLIIRKLR
ncbi:DMT family transporter [Candidatus Woesearchaeota archaeon]|nr:DMT family transporter [Candidatus Woesearchaeota archaeon]